MSMSNYTEKELLPAAVEVINNHPGGIDTQKLIRELRFKLKPNGEDAVILLNRSDDKFSQKVREVYYDKKTKKSIYGTTTPDEREELEEEGIDLLSIPWVSKDN